MELAASNRLDRRTLLKLASSGWIYLLGTQLGCGSEVKSEELSSFLASKQACALVEELARLQLDGAFVFDAAACTAIAQDFGHYVHETPLGILKPASARDVQKLLAFANRRSIPVVMRGTGGAAYGQTQVRGGIVVDSSTLRSIAWVSDDMLDVGPGCIWIDVVDFASMKSKIPPVLPDTPIISVGGTLSVGGIGETSYRLGAQVDHVVELDVVTPTGDLVTCSPTLNGDLHDMILGGMGQCGIIVRARIRVVDSPPRVFTREYKYPSADHAIYVEDMSLVARTEPLGAIGADLVRNADGTFTFAMKVTYWSSENPSWLGALRGTTDGTVKTWSYLEYAKRNMAPSPTLLFPHPYVACFIPKARIGAVIDALLASPSATLGAGRLGVFPMVNERFRQPLQKLPDGLECVHLRIYRIVRDGEGSANHLAMLESNTSEVLPLIFQNGGKVYLPFSPLLTPEQVREQFGRELLSRFTRTKRRYDPRSILGMSAGLFPWSGPDAPCPN